MKRHELSHLFDCGVLGLRNGVALADVEGHKVTLVAAAIGKPDEKHFYVGDILHMLTLSAQEELREKFRQRFCDYSSVSDAVFDWDGSSV